MINKHKQSPDFIGVGAMKAASGWIYRCLIEHPQVCSSVKKEIHFFDKFYDKGLDWYQSFFKNCPEDKIKGEFSPSYLYNSEVPSLIFQNFPQTKIIACLRSPGERAWSHYCFARKKGGRLSAYKNFREALERDEELAGMGFYYQQLKNFYDFFSSEQILILFYEDIKKDPESFIKEIYSFLGVKENFIPPSLKKEINSTRKRITKNKIPFLNSFLYRSYIFLSQNNFIFKIIKIKKIRRFFHKVASKNRRSVPARPDEENKIKPQISSEDKKFLKNFYSQDVKKLEELLGKKLDFWF